MTAPRLAFARPEASRKAVPGIDYEIKSAVGTILLTTPELDFVDRFIANVGPEYGDLEVIEVTRKRFSLSTAADRKRRVPALVSQIEADARAAREAIR